MGDAFSVFFGIIWIVLIISVISGVSKKAKQASRLGQTQQRPQQYAPRPQAPQSYDAQQARMDQVRRLDNKSRSAGQVYGTGAFAKTADPGKISASKIEKSFGSRVTGTLGENAVLLEDRRNDWLAKQLREEAAIKRRGSVYDLGASHDVACDADDLKKSHVRRHNTNGVNREMFR